MQVFMGQSAFHKTLVINTNGKKRITWCKSYHGWDPHGRKEVIWSNESSSNLVPITGRVYVWRISWEVYHSDYPFLTVNYGGEWVMVWGCMSGNFFGPLVIRRRSLSILQNYLHPMVQIILPGACPWFPADNGPVHTTKCARREVDGTILATTFYRLE